MINTQTEQRLCSVYFCIELGKIHNHIIKSTIMDFIDKFVPSYFCENILCEDYHENLMENTKKAIFIAENLMQFYTLSSVSRDIIFSSILLHDMFKYGEIKDVKVFEHPLVCAKKFLEFCDSQFSEERKFYNKHWTNKIANCIASHEGKKNTSVMSAIVLPVPNDIEEIIVAQAISLANNKYIKVEL